MSDPDGWLGGGCHCGAVRFRVRVQTFEAIVCNCSICTKKGAIHLIVPPEDFVLETDPAALTSYRFGTGVAEHRFCSTCGIHPFYAPRSHPDHVDVNVRCLDGDAHTRFTTVPFDGQHWEASIGALR